MTSVLVFGMDGNRRGPIEMKLAKKTTTTKGGASDQDLPSMAKLGRRSTRSNDDDELVMYSSKSLARKNSLIKSTTKTCSPNPIRSVHSEDKVISSFSRADYLRDKTPTTIKNCDSNDIGDWETDDPFLKPVRQRRNSLLSSPSAVAMPESTPLSLPRLPRRKTISNPPSLPLKQTALSVQSSLTAGTPKIPSVVRLSSLLKKNNCSSSSFGSEDSGSDDEGKKKKRVVCSEVSSLHILPGEYKGADMGQQQQDESNEPGSSSARPSLD
jgi:hypothetical protein